MNRRRFLRLLGLAPIVGPALVKVFPAAAQPVQEETFRLFMTEGSVTVQRWAGSLWVDQCREVYWGRFMNPGDGPLGDHIMISRMKKLEAP